MRVHSLVVQRERAEMMVCRERHTAWAGQNRMYIYTVYDGINGDFPAINTVCAPYIYGSGQQPCTWHSQTPHTSQQ